MAESNDTYKLKTRRYLVWGVAAVTVASIAFLAIWGAVQDKMEMVTLAGGALISAFSSIVGYYVGKKTSEE